MEIRERRPFACETCDLKFTTKQFLQRHYIVHTEDRNFKCVICENSYKYKKGLNRHYKKVHYPHYKKEIGSKIQEKNTTQIEEKCKKPLKPVENVETSTERVVLLDITKIIITSPFPVP